MTMAELLTIYETAHRLGVSVSRARQLRYEGKLTAYKNAFGKLRFSVAEVEALRAEREQFHTEKQTA